MRRALARKLGWSSTIKTVLRTILILAHRPSQIHTASTPVGVVTRTPTSTQPTLLEACHPHGHRDRSLGAWRYVGNPTEEDRHECQPKRQAWISVSGRALGRSPTQR